MTKRLDILKRSLEKKKATLDSKFENHFDTVREANGQPLNDKRNGQATLDKWERQNDSIRNQIESVEKTEQAIEREEGKISDSEYWYSKMPTAITKLIDNETLIQWRKHPRIMFVKDVEKARIVFDEETGVIAARYLKSIPNQAQYSIFRDVFNGVLKDLTDPDQ